MIPRLGDGNHANLHYTFGATQRLENDSPSRGRKPLISFSVIESNALFRK